MGEQNSSVTRAWPIFGGLLDRDSTGKTWLDELVTLANDQLLANARPRKRLGMLDPSLSRFERKVPRNFQSILRFGSDLRLRNCFEAEFPPPTAFLQWLVEKPSERMRWPTVRNKKTGQIETITFGEPTQGKRKSLFDGDGQTITEAIAKVRTKGSKLSRRQWWSFEGFTCVDVLLETESTILFVECKRNELLSPSTMWYRSRNQLGRNLEVAGEAAARKNKDFGVIVVSKDRFRPDRQVLEDCFPHLGNKEKEVLLDHYWGNIRWSAIQDELFQSTRLPDTVQEAVAMGLTVAVR